MSELEEVLRLRATLTNAGWRPFDQVVDTDNAGPRRVELTIIRPGGHVDFETLQTWVKDTEVE